MVAKVLEKNMDGLTKKLGSFCLNWEKQWIKKLEMIYQAFQALWKKMDELNKSLDKFKADYAKLSDDDKKWLADENA